MILGIDAGGTKTEILIAEDDGNILAQNFCGPLLYNHISLDKAWTELYQAIKEIGFKIKNQDLRIKNVVLGLAGIDSPTEIKTADSFYKEKLSVIVFGKIQVVNDMVIALAAGTDNPNAIVLNSGTGVSCLGRNEYGLLEKTSGFDFVASDEGGAYWIGQKIIQAAVRSFDKRGNKTILEKLLLDHFSISDIREIKPFIYGKNFSKEKIAQITKLLPYALKNNDEVAVQILNKAIDELALCIRANALKLGLTEKAFDLILTGGNFYNNIINPEQFGGEINAYFPKANCFLGNQRPVYGAIKMAMLG